MKVRILVGCLIVSLLFNVAGLVFFIGFLKLRGSYKAVRNERNIMRNNLTTVRARDILSETKTNENIYRRKFYRLADGQEDEFGLIPPRLVVPSTDLTLLVYFHGMGSNFTEPFVVPYEKTIASAITARDPELVFLSVDYGGEASWLNDDAYQDVNQNIRQVCQEYPIKRIVLMGTSMGGCTVLTYAATAPPDIKKKISGVVSVESAPDLIDLYAKSSHPDVRNAMILALKATPEQNPALYKQKSFAGNADKLPAGVRVAVVSARDDRIVPAAMQKQIIKMLEERKIAAKLIEIDGRHGAPPARFYLEGLDYVMNRS